jgi:hypothetical protein
VFRQGAKPLGFGLKSRFASFVCTPPMKHPIIEVLVRREGVGPDGKLVTATQNKSTTNRVGCVTDARENRQEWQGNSIPDDVVDHGLRGAR